MSYYPATLEHIAQWWVGVLTETPALPGEMLGRRPDPRHRGEYFRWCEGCRRWWLCVGASDADAMMLWGVLVAARTLGDEVTPVAEILTAGPRVIVKSGAAAAQVRGTGRRPRVIVKSGGAAVRIVAGGTGRRSRPRVFVTSGGAAVRVVAGGTGSRWRWRVARDYAVRRANPQRWARRLVDQQAYGLRRRHPGLTTEQAYAEAEARRVWHLRNPGRRVHRGRLLAEHVAVLAARGD